MKEEIIEKLTKLIGFSEYWIQWALASTEISIAAENRYTNATEKLKLLNINVAKSQNIKFPRRKYFHCEFPGNKR